MPISFSSAANRDVGGRGAGVTAVLGPTNTGKTHLAIERMLGHSSGIIGLPLRLLAREVYNKVAERAGPDAVALVTGEEKIKPASPRYWVSTVEAMPRDLDVAFLAIDEIQLGADLERGHVFTDRMLNRRGREETLVLGAHTMRGVVERLLPGAHILTRPRLSQLSFAGEKKITRLPRRSALVAFSAEEVYAIAELIRRQRGGAAVVLGALSPRTRNAQVSLYQSGDVEYLVATDAIGMGLNLDVDHVAFASDRKFDGYQYRKLNPAELAQIAGRAGRATRDGTFGTTGRCPPFETELAQALESHAFEPVRVLQWRNSAVDFSSIGALQASLAEPPKESSLTRAPIGEDILVLEHASRDEEIRALTTSRDAVERLWDVCQVPDYRKISPATHAELATTLYGFLRREGSIPVDWFARQVNEADHMDGDIDTLSNRIAHIRTWTFVANQMDWLADPDHWQGVTKVVEDKLSDALHERLTERFVDRRTSVLMRRLREKSALASDISKTGEVMVEGHAIGRLDGLVFTPAASSAGSEAKALAGAAQKALAGEIEARAIRLSQAADGQLLLSTDGIIRWLGQPVAKLVAGDEALKPRLRIVADENLTGAPRDAVQVRLDLWLKSHIERILEPLFRLAAADDVTGIARGLGFQLRETLGILDRAAVADDLKHLDQPARATLRRYGVRFGAYHVYLPALLKPGPRLLATQLWVLKHGGSELRGLDAIATLAASGRTSIPLDKEISKVLYRVGGYRICGERAVRVDILERLADLIRPALAWREGAAGAKPPGAIAGFGFTVSGSMTSLAGCSGEEFASVLRSLGYRMEKRLKPAAPPAIPAAAEGRAELPDTPQVETSLSPEASAAAPAGSEDPTIPAAAPETALVTLVEDATAKSPAAAAGSSMELPVSEATACQPDVSAISTEAPGTPEAATPALEVGPKTEPATELIEVWRPARRGDRPSGAERPHRRRQSSSPSGRTAEPAAPGASAGEPPAQPSARRTRERRSDGGRHSEPGQGAPRDRARRVEAVERAQRAERSARDRPARPDRDPLLRAKYMKDNDKERRNREADPNSPFAKLAILKERLEATEKEPR